MVNIVKVLIKSALYGDGYSGIVIGKDITSMGITEDEALDRAISELNPYAKFDVLDINTNNAGTIYTIQL